MFHTKHFVEKGQCWIICLVVLQLGVPLCSHSGEPVRENRRLSEDEQEKIDEELRAAAFRGELDEVKKCLSRGANINTSATTKGNTPLLIAAMQNHAELAKFLIKSGAEVNTKTESMGASPLFIACVYGNIEVAKILLKNGAKITDTNKRGETLLHFATNREMARLCIVGRVDVNAKNDYLQTALHSSASNGWIDVIEELIAANADTNAKDKDGKTPLDCAKDDKTREALKKGPPKSK